MRYREGTPEWGQAAKEMLDALAKRLRRELPRGRVTMREQGTEYG